MWCDTGAGDPAAADPSRIIDITPYGKSGWGLVDGWYLYFATSYLNLADSLVDPAHTSYVHKRTIGNSGGNTHRFGRASRRPRCRLSLGDQGTPNDHA